MEDAWIPLRTYISVTLAHDSSDEPSNYHETLRLRLQNECVRHAITFTRAPHIPSEKSSKQSVVWVRWVNEWSEQESPPWFYKIKKNLPSTAKQELATTLINSFRRSMGEDGSTSHPESEVWRESFEITLMHTRSYELWILLDPQDQFSDKLLDQDPNRLEKHHKTLDRHDTATKGRDMQEPGRPA